MNDHPKIIPLTRGGKRRVAVLTQPYLHQSACLDVYRLAFITL